MDVMICTNYLQFKKVCEARGSFLNAMCIFIVNCINQVVTFLIFILHYFFFI